MDLLLAANIALWVVVAGLVLVVIALTRQVGILYERIAPMGAVVKETGLKVGARVPATELLTLHGKTLAIGPAAASAMLVFFLSPTCPICKKLIPTLREIAREWSGALQVVLAGDGEADQHSAFYERERLAPFAYLLSHDLFHSWQVGQLPFAVLIDADGTVAATGIVKGSSELKALIADFQPDEAPAPVITHRVVNG
jgi:methylamine dehydrogenase accessory protein MauD